MSEYRKAYEKLGEERVMKVPNNLKETIDSISKVGEMNMSEFDEYWIMRKDYNWSDLPGQFKKVKRSRKREFVEGVTQILLHLEPPSAFSPVDVWEQFHRLKNEEKEKAEEALKVDVAKGKEKEKKAPKKKEDIFREENSAKAAKEAFYREVLKIRNSKSDLIAILKDIKLPAARAILYVQILKNAYDLFKKDGAKKLLYEVLWALEDVELPTSSSPEINKKDIPFLLVRDPSLVYDNYSDVEKLLAKTKKIKSQESDIIKLQLTEMSDRLPPLSIFSYGFKLDPWQLKVLGWIDEGKSVVICAPTSSGKTVLSSCVAVIFKNIEKSDKTVQKVLADEENEDNEDNEDQEEDEGDGPAESSVPVSDPNDDMDELVEDFEQSINISSHLLDAQTEDCDHTIDLVKADKLTRQQFFENKKKIMQNFSGNGQRVLFVVPTEPLVWQVAAYFGKILKQEGDRHTSVALVTDNLTFSPSRVFNVMPQIVVGTPLALESALTKPLGLTGSHETQHKAAGNVLPGGFDHFDWVIYDEVHALDGQEGPALQRLIRSMNCKFIALSATIGNANDLRGWIESVKGQQLYGVEEITVANQLPRVVTQPILSNTVKASSKTEFSTTIVKIGSNKSQNFIITNETTISSIKEIQSTFFEENFDQLLYRGEDLFLSPYQKFVEVPGFIDDEHPILYVSGQVNLMLHQGRFINLQRYIWNPAANYDSKRLQVVSPLAAVESVEALQQNILMNSSLSFTSSDAFSVWEILEKLFPIEAIKHLSPYSFFSKDKRITLPMTKDYEVLLKQGLTQLSLSHPNEMKELLKNFQITTPPIREFDICELLLDLKERKMLPCLPFHLNSFEAIRLFQQILSGLEYRQKKEFPLYYTQQKTEAQAKSDAIDAQIQATGRNERELEEKIRSGEIKLDEKVTVDETAPHPKYILSKGNPLVDKELKELMKDMEKYDGFTRKDGSEVNEEILEHALIRGLKRGIGLFISEVSFPSYRRMVQKLASLGKLAVVISDGSLAFGVNMPFRTCIFCGEMRGELDELMAQQMSGRAGRRGLDAEGNIIYVGIRSPFVRRLMIGTVSNITGKQQNPRYETLFLQPILSPRHTGFFRSEIIGGQTLEEFIEGRTVDQKRFTCDFSKNIMLKLGFIKFDPVVKTYVPAVNYALLNTVWELREKVHESITIGLLFTEIIDDFKGYVGNLSIRQKKKNLEYMEKYVGIFFSILVILASRTKYDSSNPRAIPFSKLHFFDTPINDKANKSIHKRDLLNKWLKRFKDVQDHLGRVAPHLVDPVPPGEELDGTFFQCALDRNYMFTLDDFEKQELKSKIWHFGNILKVLCNSCQIQDDYCRVSYFVFRNAFEKLRYLNSELISSIINFPNISSYTEEKRTSLTVTPLIGEVKPWTDLDTSSWADSIDLIVHRGIHLLQEKDKDFETHFFAKATEYLAVNESDIQLASFLVNINVADKNHYSKLLSLLKTSSFVKGICSEVASKYDKEILTIFALIWFVLDMYPKIEYYRDPNYDPTVEMPAEKRNSLSSKFSLYLKMLYLQSEDSSLTFKNITQWSELSFHDAIQLLPMYPESFHHPSKLENQKFLTVAGRDCHKYESFYQNLVELSKPVIEEMRANEEDDDEEEDEEA